MPQPSLLNKVETAADVDISVVKITSFIAVVAISAAIAGYFIATVNIIASLLALSVFWVLFSLQVLFIKGWRRIVIFVLIEAVAMILPTVIVFREHLTWYMLLALIVLAGMLLAAENYGRNEVTNSLKIPFFRTVKNALAKSIPATLMFVAIIYIFVVGRSLVEDKNQFFSENVLAPMVKVVVPSFTPKTSIKGLLEEMVKWRVGEEKFKQLPGYALEESYKETKDFIERYAGGTININSPLGSAVYDYFTDRLSDSDLMTKIYIAFALLTLVWFIIKTITIVVYLPLAFLAFILYETLIVTNFIFIQYETRSREIILLK